MHDLAREVAGVGCKVAKLGEPIFDSKLLHLSVGYQLTSSSKSKIPNSMEYLKLLRTFLLPMQIEDGSPFSKLACQQLLKRFSKLRVLDLNSLGLTSLTSSISQLVHLRLLNLSYNPIEKLPDSITNLWNLQTLRPFCCTRLRTLPINMRKLTNLRNLNVRMCHNLTQMPSGFEGLTSLNKLPQFIVGLKKSEENSGYKPSSVGKLTDLKNLQNLRGALEIVIHSNFENNASDAREQHLSRKQGLTYLKISFSQEWHHKANNNCRHDGEAVLQGLKPPSNIRMLYIESYSCQSFPVWARMDNLCVTNPYLVEIRLGDCESCQRPIFSRLLYLKYLGLYVMESVEYMEDGVYSISSSTSSNAQELETIFFPSLEVLKLYGMKNLKGWWKEAEAIGCNKNTNTPHESTRILSKLSKLSIQECPTLELLTLCPNVRELTLLGTNERLSTQKIVAAMTTPSSSESGLKLKSLRIDNAEDLVNMSLHEVSSLHISFDSNLESTEKLGEVLETLSPSLRSLVFKNCKQLKSISKGLEHLTALENLVLNVCPELDITGNEDEDSMPWKALNTGLRSLTLYNLPRLVHLPRGLQHLGNLRSLKISYNDTLEELPEWINCFSSLEYLELCHCPQLTSLPETFCNLYTLNQLRIMKCPGLIHRCQQPNGSDWYKI